MYPFGAWAVVLLVIVGIAGGTAYVANDRGSVEMQGEEIHASSTEPIQVEAANKERETSEEYSSVSTKNSSSDDDSNEAQLKEESDVSATKPVPDVTLPSKSEESGVPVYNGPIVAGDVLEDHAIDIKAVVLVRCVYHSQYYAQSTQKEAETNYSLGSGVIVSPHGHILTAGHVVRKKTLGTDGTGRTWTLSRCDVAPTIDFKTKIYTTDKRSLDSDVFQQTDIIHEPDESAYRDSTGLDVAVLRLKEKRGKINYVTPYPSMVSLPTDRYSIIAVGYPGKDIAAQILEHFTAALVGIETLKGSACPLGKSVNVCGWRYQIFRVWSDFKDDYGRYWTEEGEESFNARGGFSGGPVFYKGNLIGIVTHGAQREANTEHSDVDFFNVLASRDIVSYLSSQGITFE